METYPVMDSVWWAEVCLAGLIVLGLVIGFIAWMRTPHVKSKKKKDENAQVKATQRRMTEETQCLSHSVSNPERQRRIPQGKNKFTVEELIYYFPPDTPMKVGSVSLGTVGDYQKSRRSYE